MTLRHLALSNMRSLRRKYAAFIFSSVVAVLVFYLLASFVMHPDVVNGYVSQAERVRRGLLVSEYIIVAFTIFFVLYSSWMFVKSRKKEFGLLCLLGATKSQVSRLVVIEHAVVGAVSVAAGLGLGIPASRLMLDAMSRFLQVDSPVRYMVVVPAVAWTAGLFMALFILTGIFTALQISPRKVVRLLREHQRPKALPRYSVVVALLAVACIGGGYAVAWVVNGHTLVLAMLPVTFVVSLGTFLFFAQASVAVLRMLQRRLSFFYKGLNLLTVGDLVFRMKENAWVLATVAVLSAGVITSMGTIYTAQAVMLKDVEDIYPHALTLAVSAQPQVSGQETDADSPADPSNVPDPSKGSDQSGISNLSEVADDIRKILAEDRAIVTEEVALAGVLASHEDGDRSRTLVISESTYNAWASRAGFKQVKLDGNKAALLQPFMDPTGEKVSGIPIEVSLGGKTYTLEATTWPFVHINYMNAIQQFVVVDDNLMGSGTASHADAAAVAFFSFEFENWTRTLETSKRIRTAIPESNLVGFFSRVEAYEGRKQMTSLTAMIALFVTGMFFIASGSVLYFRLFGSIQEDREKYRSMRKLGVSAEEIGRVISAQVKVIFFAPIAVGSLHCGFAMKALSNVLMGMSWPYLGVFRYALFAIGVFSLVQVVYFLFARNAYLREIGDGAAV